MPVPVTAPLPVTLTVRVCVEAPGVKSPVTDLLSFIVIVQVDPVPEQPPKPSQPAKLAPESGVWVSVTTVPGAKSSAQSPLVSRQLIPGPVIVPGPETVTVSP